jgi:hypothetical protein
MYCGPAFANTWFTTVDLSAYQNAKIQERSGGGTFADFPLGAVGLGGVPFYIPAQGNNEWRRGGGSDHDGEIAVLNIPVNQFGAKAAYTLIDTDWGTASSGYMLIEFFGSNGAYASKDLIGNSDMRDWNLYPLFTTQINGTTSRNVWHNDNGDDGNPDVVDMQTYVLPADFQNQVLTSIRITDHRQVFVHSGILSGITVSDTIVVPEPATLFLLTLGGLLLRKRKPQIPQITLK